MKPTNIEPYTATTPDKRCRRCGTPASPEQPLVRLNNGYSCAGGQCARGTR